MQIHAFKFPYPDYLCEKIFLSDSQRIKIEIKKAG